MELMEIVKNKIFTDEPVNIDNTYFVSCSFIRATLMYSGGPAPSFDRCNFDNANVGLAGAAASTLNMLTDLCRTPFRKQIERTFKEILETTKIGPEWGENWNEPKK
jgi:hypothetical protein